GRTVGAGVVAKIIE
ncbi:hypothetical protein C206_22034, partial [Pseudomonas putida TRO1]